MSRPKSEPPRLPFVSLSTEDSEGKLMNYYNFHIGDYISHTIHLSAEEDLAYRRLLDMYYDTESPIPNNIPLVSRKLRISAEVVKTVLDEFFELTDEGFKNFRASNEIAEYHKFIEKQKTNGSKGGRPKKSHRKPTANPTQTQNNPNQEPTTNNQEPIIKERTRGSRLSADFVLPKEWEDWAKQERPDLNLQSVGEQFRDYWSAKAGSGSTKLDWQATWRNWIRNQKQVFKQADLIRTTVPSSSERDPALIKLDEDYKNAKPNPEILAKIKEAFKGKVA
jgi:uncharacterized protein YdaU (DUF1376 family)